MSKDKGKIIVIVAPSGTGKSTLLARLKKEIPALKWSVSMTTRPQREGEVHGVDYFYASISEFEEKIKEDAFVEWAKVHSNYYGTEKKFIDEGIANGEFLLFDLDVQGCDSFKKIYGDDAKIIFIEPPSVEELEKRLLARATDDHAVIQERLNNAKKELKRADHFDYKVVNDDFDRAYADLKKVVMEIIEGHDV